MSVHVEVKGAGTRTLWRRIINMYVRIYYVYYIITREKGQFSRKRTNRLARRHSLQIATNRIISTRPHRRARVCSKRARERREKKTIAFSGTPRRHSCSRRLVLILLLLLVLLVLVATAAYISIIYPSVRHTWLVSHKNVFRPHYLLQRTLSTVRIYIYAYRVQTAIVIKRAFAEE